MSVHKYLELFRREMEKLEDHGYAEFLEIREKIRPNKQADIKMKAVFVDGSALHILKGIPATA